jgi:hypothetical protein
MPLDQPIEQFADSRRVLFHSGHGIPLLPERFAVARDMEGLAGGNFRNAALFTPAKKTLQRARVGLSGIGVRDVDDKEFDEAQEIFPTIKTMLQTRDAQ